MSFLQKSAIFISNCRVSHKTVNYDRLRRSRNVKLVSFWRGDTVVIFYILKDHLGWISRNLESNLLKNLGENCEKSTFHPKITHLSMEFGLVIGTIKRTLKVLSKCIYWSSISAFRKRSKIISYFQWFLHNFSRFTPKILNAPTARVQTWLKMFLISCSLRKTRSAKFPLGGGGTNVFLARGLIFNYKDNLIFP